MQNNSYTSTSDCYERHLMVYVVQVKEYNEVVNANFNCVVTVTRDRNRAEALCLDERHFYEAYYLDGPENFLEVVFQTIRRMLNRLQRIGISARNS